MQKWFPVVLNMGMFSRDVPLQNSLGEAGKLAEVNSQHLWISVYYGKGLSQALCVDGELTCLV